MSYKNMANSLRRLVNTIFCPRETFRANEIVLSNTTKFPPEPHFAQSLCVALSPNGGDWVANKLYWL